MIKIGIDPSINSTGICVSYKGLHYYYLIPSKMTKKMESFEHDYIHLLPYTKYTNKDCEYTEKEKYKTINIHSVCQHIRWIINHWCSTFGVSPNNIIVNMEGVSYGSVGSAALVDLAGLNFAIRTTLLDLNVSFNIISPTSLKKFACANGQADKAVMINAWKRMDKNINDITGIKIDDLADSYFLSCYSTDSN